MFLRRRIAGLHLGRKFGRLIRKGCLVKCMCDRAALCDAFALVAAVAPSRHAKPVLRNVRLEATAAGVVLSATDLEIGIRTEVPTDNVVRAGAILAPATLLGAILRESADDTLTIEATDKAIVIRGAAAEFKLPQQNVDEFPALTTRNEALPLYQINPAAVRSLVRQTVFATDEDNARFALGGVLLELAGGQAMAVSTDGRRLAASEAACQGSGPPVTAIVPTRAMQLIDKAMGTHMAEVACDTNYVYVQSGATTISARLLEGRFPKWRDILEPKLDKSIAVPAGTLLPALRQAAVCTSAESRGITFRLQAGNLQLEATSEVAGNSRVDLPVSYEGEPITLLMDHRYVHDFLRAVDSEQVITLSCVDSDSIVLFQTDGYRYVVMPMAGG